MKMRHNFAFKKLLHNFECDIHELTVTKEGEPPMRVRARFTGKTVHSNGDVTVTYDILEVLEPPEARERWLQQQQSQPE
jgi:hypothetical protein